MLARGVAFGVPVGDAFAPCLPILVRDAAGVILVPPALLVPWVLLPSRACASREVFRVSASLRQRAVCPRRLFGRRALQGTKNEKPCLRCFSKSSLIRNVQKSNSTPRGGRPRRFCACRRATSNEHSTRMPSSCCYHVPTLAFQTTFTFPSPSGPRADKACRTQAPCGAHAVPRYGGTAGENSSLRISLASSHHFSLECRRAAVCPWACPGAWAMPTSACVSNSSSAFARATLLGMSGT